MAEIRVLWVEDDPDDYVLNRPALSAVPGLTFGLTWVMSYEAALEAIGRDVFDICLVDYRLGAHTGLDVVRAVAELGISVPMILLTGLEDESTAMSAVGYGAQDYLVKGQVSGGVLVRAIRYAIERHKMQTALRDLSLQDDLTGLYNRRGFYSMAAQHLKLAQRQSCRCAIMYADLDRLKWINDRFGHQMGSRAIIEASEVLRLTLRGADIIARLGGDEFAVLITSADSGYEEAIAHRLHDIIQGHNAQAGRSFDLSISFGFAQLDALDMLALEAALAQADQAMYADKQARRMARDGHLRSS